jgi:CheY-like chemotaxis protein
MNLVVNAKDAMPTGGQLLIRTENITSEKELANVRNPRVGSYIGIHVSDTGVGIERDQLPKIFDPFFTTKETGKGTGLGLSTVFGIVKQSDGYILVDSEPGKGTTFSIYLPQSEKTPQKEESTQTQAAGANGNKTILVIEDEGGVRSMISKMLKLYGYKSYIANNGTQGLEIYDSHKQEIDLILSDVVMPGMSGMEMVRILQKTAPDIPAIFMSGYTDDEIIRHGVKEDGIHFLQKPFDPDTLIRMIRNILNN